MFALTLNQTKKNPDRSKLKAFADNEINVAQNLKFDLGRVETISGNSSSFWLQAKFVPFQVESVRIMIRLGISDV